jgi:hypothetical protein
MLGRDQKNHAKGSLLSNRRSKKYSRGFVNELTAIFFGVLTFVSGIFIHNPPQQAAVAAFPHISTTLVAPAATSSVAARKASSGELRHETTTNNRTTPVIVRTIEPAQGAVLGAATDVVTHEELTAQLGNLDNTLRQLLYQNISAPNSLPASGGVVNNIALSQIIDRLAGVTISNSTVSGLTGLTDADIPDGITATNYLPLIGGSLTGNLTATTLTATNATTTRLDVLEYVAVGGSATTTIRGDGVASTISYASTTAITTSGSAYFAVTEGNVGIGTTSPYAKLSVVGPVAAEYFSATSTTATSTFSGAIMAASSLYVLQNGYVGIGTSAPTNKLSLSDTTNQLRISYDTLNFSQFSVDATGNLTFSPSGTKATLGNQDFYICQSGACPSSTATSTAGNLFVENAVTIGSGFSLREISSTELGLYNVSGVLMVTFDQGI